MKGPTEGDQWRWHGRGSMEAIEQEGSMEVIGQGVNEGGRAGGSQ